MTEDELLDEENLNFKWQKYADGVVLNLCKSFKKKEQYRLYFESLAPDQVELFKDHASMLKLLLNMLAWVRSLKGLNELIKGEIWPLRQDCHTLTVVNNARSILDEASNYPEMFEDYDRMAESPDDLCDHLRDTCHRVLSAIGVEAE